MNQRDVLDALVIALTADVPVLLWGEPGVGKTASVNALADDLGWPIETVLASLREPSDFAGLPVVIDGAMRFVAPDWAQRLAGCERGICFFDEISTAAPSVQKALLRVVHEKVVGDLHLGSGVRMVAAANPAEVASGGWDLTAPLANRFCHLDWGIDAATIADGLAGSWPTVTALTLPEDRTSAHRAAASQVAAFLRARPGLVHRRPASAEQMGRAWPSPRSWDALIRVLAVADSAYVSKEVRTALLVGLVGDGAAAEFLAFSKGSDLPDPENLIARPTRYQRPDRDDQVHAIVGAVVDAVVARPTPRRWERGVEVLVRVAEQGNLDIAANGVRRIAAHRPSGAAVPESLEVFGEILQQIGALA